jgi:hypothetical protein
MQQTNHAPLQQKMVPQLQQTKVLSLAGVCLEGLALDLEGLLGMDKPKPRPGLELKQVHWQGGPHCDNKGLEWRLYCDSCAFSVQTCRKQKGQQCPGVSRHIGGSYRNAPNMMMMSSVLDTRILG